jgi:hypothetical protein
MDEILRKLSRQLAVGDISADQMLNGLKRAHVNLELLDITDQRTNSITVSIHLGYEYIGRETTFGVWDFDEPLKSYVENAYDSTPHTTLKGPDLLNLVPEMASVFNEVGIDLRSYPSLRLEVGSGMTSIMFDVMGKEAAEEIYRILRDDLGLPPSELDLHLDWVSLEDISERGGFKGRIRLRTEFLELIQEDPEIEVTFAGQEIREALEVALSQARSALGSIIQRVGVVTFEDTYGIVADSDNRDWRIVEMSEEKTFEETVEVIVAYRDVDDYGSGRNLLSLTNLNGNDISEVRSDEDYYADFEAALKDLLENNNRWNRTVVWLPAWAYQEPRENPLTITDRMRDWRWNEKGPSAVVMMNPLDYLKLTTTNQESLDEIVKESHSLEEYNQWIANDEIYLPIWLTIDPTNNPVCGKISGHEGRHRVAAMLKAGETSVEVTLRIKQFRGYRWKSDIQAWNSYETSFWDLPPTLKGQFSRYEFDCRRIHHVLETNTSWKWQKGKPVPENREMSHGEMVELLESKRINSVSEPEILDIVTAQFPGVDILLRGAGARISFELAAPETAIILKARQAAEEIEGIVLDIEGQTFDEGRVDPEFTKLFSLKGRPKLVVCDPDDAMSIFGRTEEEINALADKEWDETYGKDFDIDAAMDNLWEELEDLVYPLGWWFKYEKSSPANPLFRFMPQDRCPND